MSKFYDETMQSLHQAAEIAKGTLPAVPVEGLPAETYRVTGIQDMEIIKELKERLENVPDAYPDFVEGTIYYARKKPERMKAVMGYLSGHPDALSSDIVEFVSKQPDFMEDMKRNRMQTDKQFVFGILLTLIGEYRHADEIKIGRGNEEGTTYIEERNDGSYDVYDIARGSRQGVKSCLSAPLAVKAAIKKISINTKEYRTMLKDFYKRLGNHPDTL